jgi:N-acetylmuramoyl-L-alanine amidase
MVSPVSLVTIHHEGGGTPSDYPRGADGGYTYWIGATYWTHLRSVWDSYATLNYNGVSLDICLSGNRMTSPLTDADLKIISGAVANARDRGYVVNTPQVRAHKNSPGSATACPGDNTMARWNEVVAACTAGGTTPSPTPPPASKGGAMDLVRTPSGKGYYIVASDGGIFCFGDAKFYGSMGGKKLNAPVVGMALKPKGDGYMEIASDGGLFMFGNCVFYGSMGGKKLNAPIVGGDFDAEGDGYWLVGQDGGVFTFGKTGYYGSAAGKVKYP